LLPFAPSALGLEAPCLRHSAFEPLRGWRRFAAICI